MNSNIEALRKLAEKCGCDASDCMTNVEVLNAISEALGGETGARTNAEAIGHIAEVASAGGTGYDYETDRQYVCDAPVDHFEELVIPDGTTKIGNGAFALGETYSSGGDYVIVGRAYKSVAIPGSVKTIGENAFLFQFFTSVTINEGVEEIGFYAFKYCRFRNIVVPSTVKTIADGAFDSSSLAAISILADSVVIGAYAFQSCKDLASVDIKGATSIASDAFAFCNALTEINIHKPEGSIEGAPWGATNATVNWLG